MEVYNRKIADVISFLGSSKKCYENNLIFNVFPSKKLSFPPIQVKRSEMQRCRKCNICNYLPTLFSFHSFFCKNPHPSMSEKGSLYKQNNALMRRASLFYMLIFCNDLHNINNGISFSMGY